MFLFIIFFNLSKIIEACMSTPSLEPIIINVTPRNFFIIKSLCFTYNKLPGILEHILGKTRYLTILK